MQRGRERCFRCCQLCILVEALLNLFNPSKQKLIIFCPFRHRKQWVVFRSNIVVCTSSRINQSASLGVDVPWNLWRAPLPGQMTQKPPASLFLLISEINRADISGYNMHTGEGKWNSKQVGAGRVGRVSYCVVHCALFVYTVSGARYNEKITTITSFKV